MAQSFDIIIKNATILTINEDSEIIENGYIAINKDKISAIGKMSELKANSKAKQIIDAKGKIAMPGFVNTHTHLAMTLFRGIADDIKLYDWLNKYIFPAERKFVSPESVEIGTNLAYAEMIKSGTTCFNDMYYFSDSTAQTAIKAGMRGVISEGIIDQKVANSNNSQEAIQYTKFLLDKYKDNELINIAVATHAPYSCTENTLIKSYELAEQYDSLFHIHLAETKWELEKFLAEKGMSSVNYLDKLGLLSHRTIAAHGVWLNDEEINLLKDRDVAIAHNPECNMKIASGIAPIPQLIDTGVRVGLGTDGVASNNNLNFIQEMRTMALLHKLNSSDPTTLPAEQIIRIATIGGAEVIGKEKEIGSLEIGKKADIILIDTDYPNAVPFYNIYSLIVYSLNGNEISDVIINGKIVMKNYTLTTIDEKEAMQKVSQFSKKIKNL